jgi:hypothetical protein
MKTIDRLMYVGVGILLGIACTLLVQSIPLIGAHPEAARSLAFSGTVFAVIGGAALIVRSMLRKHQTH